MTGRTVAARARSVVVVSSKSAPETPKTPESPLFDIAFAFSKASSPAVVIYRRVRI